MNIPPRHYAVVQRVLLRPHWLPKLLHELLMEPFDCRPTRDVSTLYRRHPPLDSLVSVLVGAVINCGLEVSKVAALLKHFAPAGAPLAHLCYEQLAELRDLVLLHVLPERMQGRGRLHVAETPTAVVLDGGLGVSIVSLLEEGGELAGRMKRKARDTFPVDDAGENSVFINKNVVEGKVVVPEHRGLSVDELQI